MRLKKSEIAIYAISLMLVAAGYFNFVTFENKTQETYSEDIQSVSNEYANVGDAVLVSNNELEEVENNEKNDSESNPEEKVSNISGIENDGTTQNEEATANVNSNIDADNTDEQNYYASTKLDRDKMYAEMLSSYDAILNNTNVNEAQKTIATQEISKINNTKNAIMICENLILTKGFNNCVILVNEDKVNIVVNVKDGLKTADVAKIQNIVSREMETEIENIHITEK